MTRVVLDTNYSADINSQEVIADPNGAKEKEIVLDDTVVSNIGEKYWWIFSPPATNSEHTTAHRNMIWQDRLYTILYMELKEIGTATPRVLSIPQNLMLTKLLDKLESYSTYESNWDTYGGKPISNIVISNIRLLLPNVFKFLEQHDLFDIDKFELFPTSDGGVQVEIRHKKREIEIEFSPGQEFYNVLLIEIENGDEKYKERIIKKSDILKTMKWLVI